MKGKKRLLAIGGSLALILAIFGGLWFWRSVGSQPPPLLRKEREMSQYRRILAVSPALQEIVLALAPPEQIVAVSASSKNSPIPEVAQAARQVAGEVSERPSTEELLALDPDIVLMPVVFSRAQADLLADMKVNVVPLGIPNSYEELKARIMLIADALGLSDKGRALTATMDQKIAMVHEKNQRIRRPKLVIAYSLNGAFGRKNGSFDNICKEAGAVNGGGVLNLKQGEHLSKEQVVALNPDVILCGRAIEDSALHQEILRDPAFQEVKAVKNHRVVLVEDRYLSSVTQSFADAVEAVSRIVYPEVWE